MVARYVVCGRRRVWYKGKKLRIDCLDIRRGSEGRLRAFRGSLFERQLIAEPIVLHLEKPSSLRARVFLDYLASHIFCGEYIRIM